MGVLKVNVGTVSVPDWRKIGCGGHPASGVDFLDTFNRANSSTLGSPWTVYGGTWGISGNACVPISNSLASNQFTTALVNSGSASVDIEVKVKRTGHGGWSEIVFGYDPVADFGYRMRFDMGGSMALVRAHKNDFPSTDSDTMTTLFDPGADDGVYRTLRIVYDQPTATIKLYRDGTLQRTATDSLGGLTGTWVGLGTTNGTTGNAVVETFDDFTITPAVAATTGRLKLWDGTRWMREVCTADTGTGPNLLTANQNGLETGAATGWAAQPDPGFGTVFTVISADTTHAHTGTYSLKVSTSAAIDRYFATPSGTSGFAVTPGTSYEVSAFVWRSDLSDASRLAFDVRWYNSGGSLLSTSTGFLTYITPREAWEPVDFGAYTAPAGAVYGQLYGHTSAANNLTITYWLDDIVIGANVERHPLKMWDGTTWQTVACMTPA